MEYGMFILGIIIGIFMIYLGWDKNPGSIIWALENEIKRVGGIMLIIVSCIGIAFTIKADYVKSLQSESQVIEINTKDIKEDGIIIKTESGEEMEINFKK